MQNIVIFYRACLQKKPIICARDIQVTYTQKSPVPTCEVLAQEPHIYRNIGLTYCSFADIQGSLADAQGSFVEIQSADETCTWHTRKKIPISTCWVHAWYTRERTLYLRVKHMHTRCISTQIHGSFCGCTGLFCGNVGLFLCKLLLLLWLLRLLWLLVLLRTALPPRNPCREPLQGAPARNPSHADIQGSFEDVQGSFAEM